MEPLKNIDIRELGILNVAYLGDAVWELSVRTHMISRGDGIDTCNKNVKKYVNAKKQCQIYLNEEGNLNEEELRFSRRARNAKIRNFPKSCEVSEYRNATAFESLIAYWFLNGKGDKIDEIIKKYIIEGDNLEEKQ